MIQLDDGHGIVEVRFDVPAGNTLMLRDDVVTIDPGNSQPVVRASIASVNPAAPARYAETPAIRKLLLPANAPLPGGRLNLGAYSSDRHYWVAARFDTRLADDVWVTLPAFTLDGAVASFPELHFQGASWWEWRCSTAERHRAGGPPTAMDIPDANTRGRAR